VFPELCEEGLLAIMGLFPIYKCNLR